jgi:predicted component of type VI protein secretion system
MAKLILSMDGQVLKEIPLSKERITIGRKAHNDVQIDNLAVSGEHAVIVSIMDDAFLEDLGSTNGTMVNGKTVKKHFLQDNDVVELGKYKLKYMAEKGKPKAAAPAGPAAADFEKTMVLRPGAMKAAVEQARAMAAAGGQPGAAQAMRAAAVQQVAQSAAATGVADKDAKSAPAKAAAPAAVAGAGQAMPAPPAPAAAPKQQVGIIQLLSGANAGRELELLKPLTTLGKPGVQVAVFTRRPHGYFITHVEGAQQPAVNGQSIGNAPHALKDHDMIELAGVKMEFFLKG